MGGKSNKVRNRKGAHGKLNSAEIKPSSAVTPNVKAKPSELSNVKADGTVSSSGAISTQSNVVQSNVEVNEHVSSSETLGTQLGANQSENAQSENQAKQGEIHLYSIPVKTQGGEKLELQLSPGDSVMDVRQFLLDAPATCFFTCYDLLLHTKDGSLYELEDYNEISEVADITAGDCSLEMVAALYDDRSMRAHVQRTRDLLSLSTLHSSLSTSLALQHEIGKSTPASSGVSSGSDVHELDNLGFMDDVTGSLNNLLSSPSKEIKCVGSIVFSSFNPPPSYRRIVGDLIYLDVITLEEIKFCITGTTKMFYVNSSTKNTLDPRPSKTTLEAATLIGLLQKISPKFKTAFNEVLEQKASAHPFENVQSLLPPNSWLELYPIPGHKRDAARAENAFTLSFGSELIGMQRDWNEELQSCREFPHITPQERILRDRALYKVTSDFVDAATRGAIGVISRCIPPINPTDPECFHMYVHNNIFFSFAVDADLDQLSRKRVSDVPLNKENASSLRSPSEKTSNKLSPEAVKVCSGDQCNGLSSVSQDCCSGSHCDGSADSFTQLAESEQATYASANNDLKGTKAYQEADVPGLYNLAMAIIDYRGHRVVAQSVLPGILQGDKSDSLLYGSVDNGKKICWNEDFHSKVLEAAKRLHLKEHMVFDGSGDMVKLAAPVESKGIAGSDDRQYLLDLMRVTPRDANYTGQGSRFCILRPELISAFCQAEAVKSNNDGQMEEATPGTIDSATVDNAEKALEDYSKEGKPETQECALVTEPVGNGELCEQVSFNPNVFTEFKLAGSEEEIAVDEENVRKGSVYLRDIVLPKFIEDLCTLEVSPMDGQTLTDALHAHGINIRYIGKVAEGTKHLPHMWDLCCNEIVVRCAKHILKEFLRKSEDHDIGPAISHFFNCFFGTNQAPGKGSPNNISSKSLKKDLSSAEPSDTSSKVQAKLKNGAYARRKMSCLNVAPDSLWSDISEFAKAKYQFMLPEDARSRIKGISVIRNLCQKVGVAVAARKYDLEAATPFKTSDILNLQPIVKHSIPLCSEAKDLVETGKVRLAEGMLSEAYTLFSEAFTILQQVTGPMHREVANCCRYLAMVLYHAGDMSGAIMQQHKELIINERCLGLDHPDTAHSYGNMALFYHGLNQTDLALRHMSRALILLSLSSGPDHPDVAATFINVAMMYQDIGKMNTALRYLQEALEKNKRLLGDDHIHTAVCYHALAITFNCIGAFKLSHQHEKKTYDILVKQLGEEDSRTRDSQNWMNKFKMSELQVNAQKQKDQALDAASARKAIDLLKAHPDLIQAFQAAAASGGLGNTSTSANKPFNSGLIGEAFPRGRGVDERAARAAAEARKKAAARGLSVRPQGVPVQALPPLTQFLNIINSGATADNSGSNNSKNSRLKKEANGHIANEEKVEQSNPVGLGSGLGSLDSKKQKNKSKVTA